MHSLSWFVRGFYKPICAGATPSPHIKFTFRWTRYRVWYVPLDALIDTGSPFTAIAPRDAERFQISFRSLKRDPSVSFIDFGGVRFIPRLAHGAELIFTDEKGEKHNLQHEPLYVLEPNLPRNKWRERGVYLFPNVIGMDFLTKHKVKLHADCMREEITLEFQK